MKIEIVPATLEHVVDLVEHLRDKDQLTQVKLGNDFEKLVVKEVADSVLAWAGLIDGKCGALWGVKMGSVLSGEGILWMLGGELIDKHPVTFLRHSRQQLTELHGTFKVLRGCVLTEYGRSRRWLEWLGFEIGPDKDGICYCEYRFV